MLQELILIVFCDIIPLEPCQLLRDNKQVFPDTNCVSFLIVIFKTAKAKSSTVRGGNVTSLLGSSRCYFGSVRHAVEEEEAGMIKEG